MYKAMMALSMKKSKLLFYIMLIVAACVSMVFTNISYDVEYQVSMALRFIKGDQMIIEMWEPHQTSAFLCALLLKIYILITGTTTGVILYMQIMGFAIRSIISVILFREMKRFTDEKVALVAAVFYMLISPKELMVPEFANMQLWFGTLMLLLLLRYLKTGKWYQLVLSAICLCLGVFSYPSFVIVYFACLGILYKQSAHFKKDISIFTSVCVLIGTIFVGYLFIDIGIERILSCLRNALALEPSHTVNMFDKTYAHIINMLKIFGMLVGVGIIGVAVEFIKWYIAMGRDQDRQKISWNRCMVNTWYVLMFFLFINILSVKNRGGYAYPFLMILILGYIKHKLLTAEERIFYNAALAVSILSLLATLILSNNAALQATTYMLIWICASLMPLYRWFKVELEGQNLKKMFQIGVEIFLLLIIFRCIYIHIPFYGRAQIYSITSDVAFVRSGPAIGILGDEEGVARQRDSMAEWKRYIQPGDTIWIVGEPADTMGYLYEDIIIGAPSVMSTPTYAKELEYYWEINPDKYPDVVIVASGFGELSWDVLRNEWLMEWLKEYEADEVVDGNYWRYYIKRQ